MTSKVAALALLAAVLAFPLDAFAAELGSSKTTPRYQGLVTKGPPPIYTGQAALCNTCGGAWPLYVGTIPTASGAQEFGNQCSGSQPVASNDTFPQLCTK